MKLQTPSNLLARTQKSKRQGSIRIEWSGTGNQEKPGIQDESSGAGGRSVHPIIPWRNSTIKTPPSASRLDCFEMLLDGYNKGARLFLPSWIFSDLTGAQTGPARALRFAVARCFTNKTSGTNEDLPHFTTITPTFVFACPPPPSHFQL